MAHPMKRIGLALAVLGLVVGVRRNTDAENIYQTPAPLYGNNESDVVAGSIGGFAYLSNPNTVLGTFGGAGSQANAINNMGQVVGYAQTSNPMGYGGTLHAFLYSGGVMPDWGAGVGTALNNHGVVVGNESPGDSNPFLYSGEVMQDWRAGVGTAINTHGVVVGNESPGGSNPFLSSNGVNTVLNDGGIGFIPHAINDDGVVVGASTSTAIGTSAQAFLDTNGEGFVKLADLLAPGSFRIKRIQNRRRDSQSSSYRRHR